MSRDIRSLVQKAIAQGRVLRPVRPGEKATRFPNWSDPNVRLTPENFADDDNIAERLDEIKDVEPSETVCMLASNVGDVLASVALQLQGRALRARRLRL